MLWQCFRMFESLQLNDSNTFERRSNMNYLHTVIKSQMFCKGKSTTKKM